MKNIFFAVVSSIILLFALSDSAVVSATKPKASPAPCKVVDKSDEYGQELKCEPSDGAGGCAKPKVCHTNLDMSGPKLKATCECKVPDPY